MDILIKKCIQSSFESSHLFGFRNISFAVNQSVKQTNNQSVNKKKELFELQWCRPEDASDVFCVLCCITFRLEKERSQAHAQAQAEAQALVKDEVSRILALERASAEESIQKVILRERVTAEDERLQAQIYVSQSSNTKLHDYVLNS